MWGGRVKLMVESIRRREGEDEVALKVEKSESKFETVFEGRRCLVVSVGEWSG